jgi:hypothetical protein
MITMALLLALQDPSWVSARVDEWRPKASERKFDRIGWLTDIRAGLALAKQHNRPLFLFTHDGHMAIGRC